MCYWRCGQAVSCSHLKVLLLENLLPNGTLTHVVVRKPQVLTKWVPPQGCSQHSSWLPPDPRERKGEQEAIVSSIIWSSKEHVITSVVFYWLHILEPIPEHEGQLCKNVNTRRQGLLGTISQAGYHKAHLPASFLPLFLPTHPNRTLSKWFTRRNRKNWMNLRWASQVVLVVKSPTASAGDIRQVGWSLGWEDPLEEETATHFSIFGWRIPCTKEPGGLQAMESDITEAT